MFGFEESYGYLIKSFVRDKDAIQALVLLAEVAAYYKNRVKLYMTAYRIFLKNTDIMQKNHLCYLERC